MQNWSIDPQKKDYIIDKGRPVETDSLTIPAYIRIKVRRTQWIYAPDSNYGSDFYLIQKRRTSSDNSLIENTAGKALQPIVDDGRSSGISVDTQQLSRGGVGINVQITDARGDQDEPVIIPIE